MTKSFEKKGLTKKSENISDWYHDVVLRAGLVDYSSVKGSMIIKPRGYALWEKVHAVLDKWFKSNGVQNAYFPLFIPYHLLQKEKDHLRGFSPELAVVTHGGGEKLKEPYVVRPTSETIMYATFAEWIQSYRDLPLKINQWCNVVRWEKRTYPFLRTTEFLWQEGHTAHRNEREAIHMAEQALSWYKKFYEDYFAISGYVGIKSESEKFAGAKTTYAIELVMPDGRALQGATSHNLSDHFAKVFDIGFLDERGKRLRPYQTSWGLSTRSIGGLILVHGDDSGLVLPPMVASPQVVIIMVADSSNRDMVVGYTEKISAAIRECGIEVAIDDDHHSLGYRINEWELRGTPLRIEIGKKEVQENAATFIRRDTFEKTSISQKEVGKKTKELLDRIQRDLFIRSAETKEKLTRDLDSYEEMKKLFRKEKLFVRGFWCENASCEAKIKEETKAVTRLCELEEISKNDDEKCIRCGGNARRKWLFAQSY